MTAPTPNWLGELIDETIRWAAEIANSGPREFQYRPPELWVDQVHDACGSVE
jgi:hypothetical protein